MQPDFIVSRPTSAEWRTCLQRLGAWVLDQPPDAAADGMRPDELRPHRIGRELELALQRNGLAGCTVVEWRWNSRCGHAQGWLWSNGLLQRFHWQRSSDALQLSPKLQGTHNTIAGPLRPID